MRLIVACTRRPLCKHGARLKKNNSREQYELSGDHSVLHSPKLLFRTRATTPSSETPNQKSRIQQKHFIHITYVISLPALNELQHRVDILQTYSASQHFLAIDRVDIPHELRACFVAVRRRAHLKFFEHLRACCWKGLRCRKYECKPPHPRAPLPRSMQDLGSDSLPPP